MRWFCTKQQLFSGALLLGLMIAPGSWSLALAQTALAENSSKSREVSIRAKDPVPALSRYFDPVQGTSSSDLVRRALASNGELAAARIEIEKARARVRQAGLRPNPTLDFGQTTGSLTNSPGEQETSIGIALPIETGGKRRRRIELAQAELEAVVAEVAERERKLANEVRVGYAEALAALRELDTMENVSRLDLQTTRFVQARVNEGESPPLELNLLMVEVDRLRSRRALIEGRLTATLLKLQSLSGIPAGEPIRLREDLTAPSLDAPPATVETAIEIALRSRPDLRLARLNEEVAEAGLSLARSLSAPELTAFTRFTVNKSTFDETPVGVLSDRDKLLSFGVSVGIPVFNRNQGSKAEAAATISQARIRREFVEAVVRADVRSAYARYQAAHSSVATFELGVVGRSNANINVIRAAYEIGEFRISELITEQRRLLDSQREFTEALTEQYRALSDLQAALGIAPNK